uniref:Uncharacterized protein n=1 Tax=Mycena chlorophos TaxID=658473 RepID=A0ABQ0M7K8_MYCCL|nr:predicted protein [Mycena chlorophos]
MDDFLYHWPGDIVLDDHPLIDEAQRGTRRRYFTQSEGGLPAKLFITGQVVQHMNQAGKLLIIRTPGLEVLDERYNAGIKFIQAAIRDTLPARDKHIFDYMHCTPLFDDDEPGMLRMTVGDDSQLITVECNNLDGLKKGSEFDDPLLPGNLVRCAVILMREEVAMTTARADTCWRLSSAPGHSQASNVQWQRRLFTNHPGKSSNNPMAKTGSGKTKVICTLCLEGYILRDQNDDLMNGREMQSRDVLALGYFNADKDSSTRVWLDERPAGLLRHLASQCPHQPDTVKSAAQLDLDNRKRRQAEGTAARPTQAIPPPPAAPPSFTFPSPDAYGYSPYAAASPSPSYFPPHHMPFASGGGRLDWEPAHARTQSFEDL